MGCHPPRQFLSFLLLVLAARSAPAQGLGVAPLVRPGLERDELARVNVLLDSTAPFYSTLRTASRQLPWHSAKRATLTLLSPEFTLGYNSALPYGFNDGSAWQGRGLNMQVMAGVVLTVGPLRVIAAPEVWTAQNQPFQTIPYPQDRPEQRSVWANPFHPAPAGIDLPLRLGSDQLRTLSLGQSSVTVRLPQVEFGLSTENVWWGPGKQNALLWGSQGAGVPVGFVRTAAPLKTKSGTWDAWYAVGALRESGYFHRLPGNDARSLGAIALSWRPPASSGLEFGLARLVILADGVSASTLVAPFGSVGRPNGPDSLSPGTRDQITSLWTRWAAPGTGFEAWLEWARFEEPASLRDLLESPGHSQGYTMGLQWARLLQAGRVRLWAEGTYLEPSPSLRLRPVGATYVSRSVPQGFTVQGQPLGAGIGPGASSQWIGGDWIGHRWRAGTFAARIRTDNAALFTPVVPEVRRQDISLVNGLRLGGEWWHTRVLLDWSHVVRLNYLSQAYLKDPFSGRTQGIDLIDNAVTVTFSTPWQRGLK